MTRDRIPTPSPAGAAAPARPRPRVTRAGAVALALVAVAARAGAPNPALPAPLTLAGAGPYYTLHVPFAARLGDARATERLRVRNAAGETLPFAWADAPPGAAPAVRAPATMYKVPVPKAPRASSADEPPQPAWIVDTHDGRSDLARLDLVLAPGAQGVFALSIEASDDLQHWRLAQPRATLVRLQQLPTVGGGSVEVARGGSGGEKLESTGIDLDGVPARYLRLTTLPGSAAPPLQQAAVTRVPRQAAPTALDWSDAIAPTGCELSHCDYALPPGATVDALQVELADPDTVGQVTVLARVEAPEPPRHPHLLRGTLHALRGKTDRRAPAAEAGTRWEPVAAENAYWLRSTSGGEADLRSPPIRLGGDAWPVLRLQTQGEISQLGHAPPRLRVGMRPRTLVFLARGAGPFVLVDAGPGATGAASAPALPPPLTLAELMPARAATAPLPADHAEAVVTSPQPAPAAARPAASAAASRPTTNSPWLWGALLAGLALMAGFAWSLLRKARHEPEIDPTSLT